MLTGVRDPDDVEEDVIEHGFADDVLDYSRVMTMAELQRELDKIR